MNNVYRSKFSSDLSVFYAMLPKCFIILIDLMFDIKLPYCNDKLKNIIGQSLSILPLKWKYHS